MKKYLTIVAALLTLNILGAKAQTSAQLTDLTCGETVTITATADEGYTFQYWEDDKTKTNPVRVVTITSELDLYNYVAVFTQEKTYALSISYDDTMGKVTGGEGSFVKGTKVTLKAEPLSKCYKFKEWKQGSTVVGTDAELEVTVSDVDTKNAYEAVFEQVEFTVKVSTVTGGKVTIARK